MSPTWIAAGPVGVASVPLDALTSGPMGPDNALGIGGTVTRVHTVLRLTCQHLGALLIHGALWSGAGHIGVTSVLGRTVAPGSVISALTQSCYSTLGEATGQHTVPVDTFVRQRTLQVTLTPS